MVFEEKDNAPEKRVELLKEFLANPRKDWEDIMPKGTEGRFLRFESCNISGVSIGKVIPMRHAPEYVKNGMKICGLIGWMMTNWGIPNHPYWTDRGFVDVKLIPDMTTIQVVGYQTRMARVICNMVQLDVEKSPCPRTVCMNVIAQLREEFGLELWAASEFEFQMLRKKTKEELEEDKEVDKDQQTDWAPCWNNMDIFSTRETMKRMDFVQSFESSFLAMGVDLNAIHTEYAPGQLEISIKPRWGIEGADSAFTFKTGIKEMADKGGRCATFMARPFGEISTACSNGGHFNHSLWKTNADGTKTNVFWNNGQLSDTAKWWIGGIMKHHDAICALTNPTPNCFERLVDHSWAPTRQTWAIDNRTALIRAQLDSEKRCYLEYRGASAAQNPYNVYAAVLLAGMDGLRNKLDPGPETKGNGYNDTKKKHLPETLVKCLEHLKKDDLIVNGFGKTYIDLFCATKEGEMSAMGTGALKMGKLRATQDMFLSNV